MIGKTIAHYKILGKLGAGGMGEVYQAEDLGLSRCVAIKVLPELFAGDPERLARFEREAKVLASLNHPNIAAIYGVEEAEGKRFLILELVEGETLAERLGKGPIAVEEALDICRQIAEGLEGAHEKSIIHRDLKPSNVKITTEGKVKILDFGLARAYRDQSSEVDLAKSPTITANMTQPGVILGTAAYMSPEQAKGKAVDKRADIWAFGCILYECLTGNRPFQGETITETLAAILRGEPDWRTLPAATPWKVKGLVRRCLEKDPRERLHDIADARIELTGSDAQSEMPPAPGERRLRLGWALAGMAATLILGAAVAGWVVRANSPQPKPDGVVRSAISVEPGRWLDGLTYGIGGPTRTSMAITPDGKSVIYGAIVQNPAEDAKPRLFSRPLDQLEAKPIAGTEGGTIPFLSPDGRWLGFWAEEELRAVPLGGGEYRRLCKIGPAPFGFSWGPDGTIAFADQEDSGIFLVSADGGKPNRLTQPDPAKGEYGHRLPSWLPNGKALLFTIAGNELDQHPQVAVLRLDTGAWHSILKDASDARYVPTGHLVFARLGKLMAVPFALDTLKPDGTPVPIISDVRQALNAFDTLFGCGAAQFSFSSGGSLLYAEGGVIADSRIENSLVWVDQKGESQPASPVVGPNWGPRISPDGRKLAVSRFSGKAELDIIDFKRSVTTPILRPDGSGYFPIWTPKGDRLVFSNLMGTYFRLCAQGPEPNAPMEQLIKSQGGHGSQYASSWAPDG